jgi:hypothetical protein
MRSVFFIATPFRLNYFSTFAALAAHYPRLADGQSSNLQGCFSPILLLCTQAHGVHPEVAAINTAADLASIAKQFP